MPYKDPERQKQAQLASWYRRKERNLEGFKSRGRQYRIRVGRTKLCEFPNCKSYRASTVYCKLHSFENTVSDKLLYHRTKKQVYKITGNAKIALLPREIFLVMLVLNNARQELLKTKRMHNANRYH